MTNTPTPKSLTHDEKKAADAAFAGRPFNEAWSASARAVYDGIVKALPHIDVAIPTSSMSKSPRRLLPRRASLSSLKSLSRKNRSVGKSWWRGLRCLQPFATEKRRFRPGS